MSPRILACDVAADVTAEPVRWLWPGRIPFEKVTVIDGDPGLGKSTLLIEISARVTRGDVMPPGIRGDSYGHPGVAIILSAEDGAADVLRPRLEAVNAELERVVLVRDVMAEAESTNGKQIDHYQIAFPLDVEALKIKIVEFTNQGVPVLVVIDPFFAYLGKETNSHVDHDVRRAMAPLAGLAEDTGAAIVLVRHLNKMAISTALYRGGGSIGIIGAARSGLMVAADPDSADPDNPTRVLAMTKSNLARKAPSLTFTIEECLVLGGEDGTARIPTSRVVWGEESPRTANELCALPETSGRDKRDPALQVIEHLGRCPDGATYRQVMDAVKMTNRRVLDTLGKLVEAGAVESSGKGVKGDPTLYHGRKPKPNNPSNDATYSVSVSKGDVGPPGNGSGGRPPGYRVPLPGEEPPEAPEDDEPDPEDLF